MKLLTLACSAALLIAARAPDPARAALDAAMTG